MKNITYNLDLQGPNEELFTEGMKNLVLHIAPPSHFGSLVLGWRKEKQGHANRTERCHRGRTDQTPRSVPYIERGQLSLNSILMCQPGGAGCQPPPSLKEKSF